jgi:hypothetical protein
MFKNDYPSKSLPFLICHSLLEKFMIHGQSDKADFLQSAVEYVLQQSNREYMPNMLWFLFELSYSPTQFKYKPSSLESLVNFEQRTVKTFDLGDFTGEHWNIDSVELEDSLEEDSLSMDSLSIDDSSMPSTEPLTLTISQATRKDSVLLKNWKSRQFWNQSPLIPHEFTFDAHKPCTLSKMNIQNSLEKPRI